MFSKWTRLEELKPFILICHPYALGVKSSVSYFMCLYMTIENAKWTEAFPVPEDMFANAVKWKSKKHLASVFPSEVNFGNFKCVLMAGVIICVAD